MLTVESLKESLRSTRAASKTQCVGTHVIRVIKHLGGQYAWSIDGVASEESEVAKVLRDSR
jgi:hypothetical protein